MATKDPQHVASGKKAMAVRWGKEDLAREADRDLAELRAFRLRQELDDAEKVAEAARRKARKR